MEPFTIGIICAAALLTGISTYFVSTYKSSVADDHLMQHINNQIVLNAEKDKSNEFAQTITLIIFGIIACAFVVFFCCRFAINSLINKVNGNSVTRRRDIELGQVVNA